MSKLDSTDRRLIYELDRNCRLPFSKLGSTLKISQEAARYRLQRLVHAEVINKFCTVVDAAKLGFAYYKVFLKLHNVSEGIIQKIIGFLAEQASVAWVVQTDGSYDIGFAAKAANIHDVLALSQVIDDLVTSFNCYVKKRVFCVNIAGDYLTRDYLVGRQRKSERQGFYSVLSEPVEIDALNLQIVKLLAIDARKSAVELARELPIESDAVLQRIRKLEQLKVITRYNLVLNHYLFEHVHFKVFIYLNRVSPERLQDFIAYCKTKPNVIFVVKTLGEWDCELDLEVDNLRHYKRVMMELTSEFADIITDYDGLVIEKIHKYNLFP